MKRMTTRKKTGTKLPALLDRDHSLVAFNERVFSWAVRDDVPLLERLRFLSIVSSNLDEFFEVRMAPHLAEYLGEAKSKIGEVLDYQNISSSIQALVATQYTLFNEVLLPKLQKQHVHIIAHSHRPRHNVSGWPPIFKMKLSLWSSRYRLTLRTPFHRLPVRR